MVINPPIYSQTVSSPTTVPTTNLKQVAVIGHSLVEALGLYTDLDEQVGSFHGEKSASYNRLKPIIEAKLKDPNTKVVAMMAWANQAGMPPEQFQHEMEQLANLAEKNGKKLILITEPTKYDNGTILGNMEAMNQVMRDLANRKPNNIGLVDVRDLSAYNPDLLHQGPAFAKELANKIKEVATKNTSLVPPTITTTNSTNPASSSVAFNRLKVDLGDNRQATIGVQYDPSNYTIIDQGPNKVLIQGAQGSVLVSFNESKQIVTRFIPQGAQTIAANESLDRVWA